MRSMDVLKKEKDPDGSTDTDDISLRVFKESCLQLENPTTLSFN